MKAKWSEVRRMVKYSGWNGDVDIADVNSAISSIDLRQIDGVFCRGLVWPCLHWASRNPTEVNGRHKIDREMTYIEVLSIPGFEECLKLLSFHRSVERGRETKRETALWMFRSCTPKPLGTSRSEKCLNATNSFLTSFCTEWKRIKAIVLT